MDLSPFTRAGLQFTEISEVAEVSRITVGRWMRGKTTPHPLIEEKLQLILDAADEAVARGELPLPSTTPKEERIDKIKAALAAFD